MAISPNNTELNFKKIVFIKIVHLITFNFHLNFKTKKKEKKNGCTVVFGLFLFLNLDEDF